MPQQPPATPQFANTPCEMPRKPDAVLHLLCVTLLAIQHRKKGILPVRYHRKKVGFSMAALASWKMTTLEPTAWIENDRDYQNQHGCLSLNFISFQRPSAWAQFFWHNVCKACTLMLALPTLVHAERK